MVDPEAPRTGRASSHVFFGATVRYANAAGAEKVVSIVGADEVDLNATTSAGYSRLPVP